MAGRGLWAGLITFIKGMGMGAADIVPGVSGGTIALTTGIYQRLIRALDAIDHRLWNVFKENGIGGVWRRIDGNFLLVLFLGILASVFSLANLFHHLLQEHPVLVWSFFFGLIGASVYFVGRRAHKWHWGTILSFITGTAIAFGITLLSPMSGPDQPYMFFIAGMIAVSAMILPGVSGSFILVLLGAYQAVLGAIKEMDIDILAFLGAGCLLGLLVFSKLLNWMFNRYHNLTIGLLSGFLLGSLNKVWPWRGEAIQVEGKSMPGANVSPMKFEELSGQDPRILAAILLAIAGCLLIVLIEKEPVKKK